MQFLQKKRDQNTVYNIDLSLIRPNPCQPRSHFDSQALAELAMSIRQHGILQPLTVRSVDAKYELIAGERRLRAAKLAGLNKVPCIILEATEEQSAALALIENLQRKDLDFFETALGYRRLIESYGLTQAETAARLGISQSAIANKLRLLKFTPREMEFIRKADLTERHARAVLRLSDTASRFEALGYIAMHTLNVRDTDAYIERLLTPVQPSTPVVSKAKDKPAAAKVVPLVRDVRIFVNSVDRAVDVMRSTGINASYDKQDSETEVILTVRIPKRA